MENLETQTNNNLPVEENEQEITKEEDFAELVESSFHKVQEGEVVTGMVVQVTAEHVMIDVGSKSEGQIPIEQFLDEKGSLTVSVGDEVQVFLEDTEESSGQVRISKSKADKIRIWDEIAEVCETEKTISGKVISRVKGGLQVDIGVAAFLPGSQVDLRPVRNFEKYIGETFEFNVLKYNRKRGNIVLSRRPLLEKSKQTKKGPHPQRVGRVRSIYRYGEKHHRLRRVRRSWRNRRSSAHHRHVVGSHKSSRGHPQGGRSDSGQGPEIRPG